jgi:hypothetical protein
LGPHPLQIQPTLVGSPRAHPVHFPNMESVDHRFTQLHMGAEAKIGKRFPKDLGKKLFAKQSQRQKDTTRKSAGGNGNY